MQKHSFLGTYEDSQYCTLLKNILGIDSQDLKRSLSRAWLEIQP
jgi:hypothetical protein